MKKSEENAIEKYKIEKIIIEILKTFNVSKYNWEQISKEISLLFEDASEDIVLPKHKKEEPQTLVTTGKVSFRVD